MPNNKEKAPVLTDEKIKQEFVAYSRAKGWN